MYTGGMPASYIRKRVVDLLRPRHSHPPVDDVEIQEEEQEACSFSLLAHLYLTGLSGHSVKTPELYFGKTGCHLPLLQIDPLRQDVVAACTGPDGGLTKVDGVREEKIAKMVNLDDEMALSTDGMDTDCEEGTDTKGSTFSLRNTINGVPPVNESHCDWIDWDWLDEERAFGTSVSLYERNPLTGVPAGNPIADVFAVCARCNNGILALADGVNWGEGSRLAARCAVRGAMDHLNNSIHLNKMTNTNEVFHELLASFHSAHSLILQEGGQLTTLCVAVALPVSNSTSWVLCVCNVGDSLCFVYNTSYGVREVTTGSHSANAMRDMRDAGGALGPVDGRNPQLQNLTCSETFVEPGDVIFITSDGISDNFDPVVGKFCVIKRTEENENVILPRMIDRKLSVSDVSSVNHSNGSFHRTKTCAASIPCVDAIQRQNLMLLRMRDMISEGSSSSVDPSSPSTPRPVNPSSLCHSLTQFATQISSAKRRTLENPELYKKEKLTKSEERNRRKMVRERIAELPGKLDHASVVAYRVGEYSKRVKKTPKEWNPPPEWSIDVPTKEINIDVSLEHFNRISRANCSSCWEDKEGEREEVILKVEREEERATSPYEEIKVGSSARSSRGRKHERGSNARHTLGVDVAWLKRLVTRKEKGDKDKMEEPSRSLGKRIRGILGSTKNVPQQSQQNTQPSTPDDPPIVQLRSHDTLKTRPLSAAQQPLRKCVRPTASASHVS